MRAVIESIKGSFVRCLIETGDSVTISKKALPEELREGDIIRVKIEVDEEATKKQRELMKNYPS